MPFNDVNASEATAAADREAYELLQLEVERLQYELAERDAQLAELGSLDYADEGEEEGEPDEALLTRLEDLLAELERNDERGAMLEQLLRAAEEKNRAEQEERRHLAGWVDDIEQRFGERDAEWQAERDALTHRVETVLAERDGLMDQLRERCSHTGGAVAASTADLDQLQATNLSLRQELHEAQEHCLQLEEQVRERNKQLSCRTQDDTKLREEQLQLAQERAELARQQAELTTAQATLQELPRRPETEIDCRLREFRQHLREIHSQEQQNPVKTSRLSRLWARIEGR